MNFIGKISLNTNAELDPGLPYCIKFNSTNPKNGLMQVHTYDRPFSTIGIDLHIEFSD